MNVTPIKKESMSLAPTNLEEAMRFADMLASSNIVPKDYIGKPGNCLVAIQWGFEIGLQPMQAMQSIAVINGRPSLWGDAMLALVKAHPSFEWIKEEADSSGATCTIKRRGEPEVVQSFTVEDAKRAGLYGKQGPWQQYPKRMLQMRARGFALRDAFPDALRGVISAEEAQDSPAERDMGTAEVVEPEKEAPATRTTALKDKLGVGKGKAKKDEPPAAPAITLKQALDAIAAMTGDKASRDLARAMAEKLTDPGDIAKASEHWKARMEAIKNAAEEAQQQSAQPPQPDPQDEALRQVEQAGRVDPATGEWTPSPEEEAAIRERERLEAGGDMFEGNK